MRRRSIKGRALTAGFIRMTVTLDILMGGPIIGAAMNPARHLGPALISGPWGNTYALLGWTAGSTFLHAFLEKE